jgi:hypothetical protein
VKNNGSWCPICQTNIGEELVRATLQEAFPNHKFIRTRKPEWLCGLELDGYNEELKLAFEYNGIQHYNNVDYHHGSVEKLEKQKENDMLKAEYCRMQEVHLMVVPYTVKFKNIRSFVREYITTKLPNLEISPIVGKDEDFYNSVRSIRTPQEQFDKFLRIVAEKGGVCKSTKYAGYNGVMHVVCKEGHLFETSHASIDQPASRGPRFCAECGGTKQLTDDKMSAFVEASGYIFVSSDVNYDSAGKRRTRIAIKCNRAQHTRVVNWDVFMKVQRCDQCPSSEILNWSDKYQIYTPVYDGSKEHYHDWTCSNGHVMKTKFSALLKRGDNPCLMCLAESIAAKYDSVCTMTEVIDSLRYSSLLKWKHNQCNTVTTASMKNIEAAGYICSVCKK